MNTGDMNTGNMNTGDMNIGNMNTGDMNTGNMNTGDMNIGNMNTGDMNTGDMNIGKWNIGNRNTGYFNTETPEKIMVFDSECNREDFNNWEKPDFIYFKTSEWVYGEKMSADEKEQFPEYKTLGGYLKKYDYKEAFTKSWNESDKEDRKKIFNCPNFDAEKFKEISGIDVNVDSDLEAKKRELIKKANELLKQAEGL